MQELCNSSNSFRKEKMFCIFHKCRYLCDNILTNTESVALFSLNERRKFDFEEGMAAIFLRHILLDMGVGLLLILSSRFPTTCLAKISLRHHAFFFFIKSTIEVRVVRIGFLL